MVKIIKKNREGEVNYNNNGYKMTIIKYNNCGDINVQFENGYNVHTQYRNFKIGNVSEKDMPLERTGEINYNTNGSKMKIIKYITSKNIIVKFKNNNFITHTTYGQFKNGEISDPYDKTICDIGYIGEGKYKVKKNKMITSQYKTWRSLFQRCYDEKYINKYPTYKDCTVCKEWHNYQNFGEWYDENYYKIDNEKMCLDKDILYKSNKLYSPETCVFVPNNINLLFIKSDAARGEYPIGVCFRKEENKFIARCSTIDTKINKIKRIFLGYYSTPKKAFYAYKEFKEKYIKQVADEYKNKYPQFPQKLYDAMYRYEVDITD